MTLSPHLLSSITQTQQLLSEEGWQLLSSRLHFQTFSKNRILLESGDISTRLYFIEKGIIRGYYVEDDRVITSRILVEGDAICSNTSFFRQIPADEYLETLEETSAYSISYRDYREVMSNSLELSNLSARLFEHSLIRYEERVRLLREPSAKKRIRIFREQYPVLAARIPQNVCASFLGLTAQTYSRQT